MTKEQFTQAAEIIKNLPDYTDRELKLLIDVHECLEAYFSALGESILTYHFRRELESLESYREARAQNGRWRP